MLQRNINERDAVPAGLGTGLEDLLADLRHARRSDDLSRLALLAYCEVRRWARQAGEAELAERAAEMITRSPHASRAAFLSDMDLLIRQLERLQPRFSAPAETASPAGR